MQRVILLNRRFDVGGAERQIVALARGLDPERFEVTVVSFYGGGDLAPQVAALPHVRVRTLAKRGRWDVAGFLARLQQVIADIRPHIIYSFLAVANQLALLTGKRAGASVVWGIRSMGVGDDADWLPKAIFRTGAWTSRWADLTISNSWAGRDFHLQHGYDGRRMIVIPNGIDTAYFTPNPDARRRWRVQWGLEPEAPVVGIVARLDRDKGHVTFLRAAAAVAERHPDLRLVVAGAAARPGYAESLRAEAEALGLGRRVVWAGSVEDPRDAFSALDVAVSSSLREGFPNAVGEAMACGIPIVVTDAGDSARILGDARFLVPRLDSEAMARAIERVLALSRGERAELGGTLRRRIELEFSPSLMIQRTEAALASVAAGAAR